MKNLNLTVVSREASFNAIKDFLASLSKEEAKKVGLELRLKFKKVATSNFSSYSIEDDVCEFLFDLSNGKYIKPKNQVIWWIIDNLI